MFSLMRVLFLFCTKLHDVPIICLKVINELNEFFNFVSLNYHLDINLFKRY